MMFFSRQSLSLTRVLSFVKVLPGAAAAAAILNNKVNPVHCRFYSSASSPLLFSSSSSLSRLSRNTKVVGIMSSSPEPKIAKLSSTASSDDENRLIWIDCEMTGLDVNKQCLVEIACIITESNRNLTTVWESDSIIIHRDDKVLDAMEPWCKETFGKNGLTKSIRKSKISVGEAEQTVLEMVRKYTKKGVCPLAGNTVYMDRLFIQKEMPDLAAHLHYRTVDVSTLKELCRRWYPKEFNDAPKKKFTHRALDDIRESINELRYYESAIMKR